MGLLGSGVGGDDQAVRAPVVVVVAGGEVEDGGGELVGERGPVGGRAEPDLGVDGHRGQPLPGGAGLAADLAHHPPGESDEVLGREPVGGLVGVGGGLAEGGGGHDVIGGCRPEHPLGDAAPPALLHQL